MQRHNGYHLPDDEDGEFDDAMDNPMEPRKSSVSLNDVRKKKKKRFDPKCPGCVFGFSRPNDPQEEPEMHKVFSCYEENRHRLDIMGLCQLLETVWDKEFVEPTKKDRDPFPPFTAKQWFDHFEDHYLNFDHELEKLFFNVRDVGNFLLDSIGDRDEITDEIKPNKEMAVEYLKYAKEVASMITTIQLAKQGKKPGKKS